MRCKNCGADNNDNRYICEVCGSPLYDEEEIMPANDNQKTQTFNAVSSQSKPAVYTEPQKQDSNNNDNKNNSGEKKNVIIIAVLVVILIAVVASIVAIANNNKKEKEPESELTKYSSTVDEGKTTDKTTEKTTEETTESTTTTEKQTTATKWIINASSSGGGEVEGDGEYYNGDKVILIARADDGYVFEGWYSNGIKVSSNTKYTFTANENASFSAVFNQVEYEPPTDNSDDTEVNFGE